MASRGNFGTNFKYSNAIRYGVDVDRNWLCLYLSGNKDIDFAACQLHNEVKPDMWHSDVIYDANIKYNVETEYRIYTVCHCFVGNKDINLVVI